MIANKILTGVFTLNVYISKCPLLCNALDVLVASPLQVKALVVALQRPLSGMLTERKVVDRQARQRGLAKCRLTCSSFVSALKRVSLIPIHRLYMCCVCSAFLFDIGNSLWCNNNNNNVPRAKPKLSIESAAIVCIWSWLVLANNATHEYSLVSVLVCSWMIDMNGRSGICYCLRQHICRSHTSCGERLVLMSPTTGRLNALNVCEASEVASDWNGSMTPSFASFIIFIDRMLTANDSLMPFRSTWAWVS